MNDYKKYSESAIVEMINKVKYPCYSDENIQVKYLGELQIQSAQNYLTVSRDSNKIVKDLRRALGLRRYDFASAIHDEIMTLPSEKPKTKELQRRIREVIFRDRYYSDNDLSSMEEALSFCKYGAKIY